MMHPFFNDEVWTGFLAETNRYVNQFLGDEAIVKWMDEHKYSTYHKWPINGLSMLGLQQYRYIGLLLNMGFVGKKKIPDYWSTAEEIETPYFNKVMTCKEFQLIRRMKHLNDVTKEKKGVKLVLIHGVR